MLLALTKQDNIIRLESRHLKISSKSGGETDIIPVNLLDRVILTEPSRISGAVMQQLLEVHIPVILIGKNGKYLGQMHYTPGGDCQRRRLQAMLSPVCCQPLQHPLLIIQFCIKQIDCRL